MKNKILLSLFVILTAIGSAKANNISVSNVLLQGQNTSNNTTKVKFDIAWENSWRTSSNESNYDGAWLFVKFRKKNTSLWQHASLNYVAPGTAAACGHTEPSGSTIQTASDSKGCWMYRAADGQGNISWTDAQVQWNYGVDGVLASDSVEVRVFAVEMVYVPTGNFYLGSGGTESNHFRDGAVDTYFPINSEASLTIGSNAGNLWAAGYITSGTLPAAFPKGHKHFWCMKYETSQQQYIDFLNTISSIEANNRGYSGFTGTHPNLIAPNPERAYEISGLNLLSMLDWAAMRPMTELEYEKACRGKNILPVANELAWGNTTFVPIGGVVFNGTASEGFSVGNVNVLNSTYNRPMRVGAKATDSSSRASSGATYYGIMEMSGNTWETVVSVFNAEGLAYTGLHGDGKIASVTGLYNVANWAVPNQYALGSRGGNYGNFSIAGAADNSSVSGRNYVVSYGSAAGGRGVRTAE